MARHRRRREPETARIDSVTHDGRGIAAIDGKKVFVSGALPGEEVRFQRRKSRRNYDEAELIEILEAAPERIEARCEAYGRCGGCALQHVSQEQQRLLDPAGTTGAAPASRSRTYTPRAGYSSVFASVMRPTSPTCIAARCWPIRSTALSTR
jgi:predicted RNA-binding protein with TRAM domain